MINTRVPAFYPGMENKLAGKREYRNISQLIHQTYCVNFIIPMSKIDYLGLDGNPLEYPKLLGASFDMWATPRTYRSIDTIPLVMKDGKIYHNEL